MATQQFLAKGQSLLKISLDTGMDLSVADSVSILYKKPDEAGTLGEWVGVVNGTNVEYEVQEGDIDVAGTWEFRAYVVIGGRDAEGDPVFAVFAETIKA